MRSLSIAVVWLGADLLICRYGVLLLPSSVAQQTSLVSYLVVVQLFTTVLGFCWMLWMSRANLGLRARLFPDFPLASPAVSPARRSRQLRILLYAPLVYVCAHALAMWFAYDTLIAELAARGRQAVQQQTGELGRSATEDSLWLLAPFMLLVAPMAEELLFRGGIYGAVHSILRTRRDGAVLDSPSSATLSRPSAITSIPGLPSARPRLLPFLYSLIQRGGGAVFVSTAIFGLMHADLAGGLGIVRVVSASVLGLACGLARLATGSLWSAIFLHASYNLIALGTMRGWWTLIHWPTKFGIPTILGPVSGVALAVLLIQWVWGRRQVAPNNHEKS